MTFFLLQIIEWKIMRMQCYDRKWIVNFHLITFRFSVAGDRYETLKEVNIFLFFLICCCLSVIQIYNDSHFNHHVQMLYLSFSFVSFSNYQNLFSYSLEIISSAFSTTKFSVKPNRTQIGSGFIKRIVNRITKFPLEWFFSRPLLLDCWDGNCICCCVETNKWKNNLVNRPTLLFPLIKLIKFQNFSINSSSHFCNNNKINEHHRQVIIQLWSNKKRRTKTDDHRPKIVERAIIKCGDKVVLSDC